MIFSASSRSLEPKCHCVWILGSKSIMDDQSAAYTQHTLHSSSWELRKRYFTLTSSGSRRRLTVCFMLSLDLAHVYGICCHPLHFSCVAVSLWGPLPPCVSFLGWLYFLSRQGSRHGNKGKMPLLFWVGNHSIWGMSDQRMKSNSSNMIQISIPRHQPHSSDWLGFLIIWRNQHE